MLVQRGLTKRAQYVDDLESQLHRDQQRCLDARRKRFATLTGRLEATDLRLRFAGNHRRQERLHEQLAKALRGKLWAARSRHESLQAHLTQLSPLSVLGRGYAIVENAQKHILRSAAEVSTGEQLVIRLQRGEIDALVSATRDET